MASGNMLPRALVEGFEALRGIQGLPSLLACLQICRSEYEWARIATWTSNMTALKLGSFLAIHPQIDQKASQVRVRHPRGAPHLGAMSIS